MKASDTPGHVDPDDSTTATDFSTPDHSTTDTAEGPRQVGDSLDTAPSSSGFISGGLSSAESVVLVCVTFGSFALAAYVLTIISEHGVHHTPLTMWTLFTILIVTPLVLAFGAGAGAALLAGIRETQTDQDETTDTTTTETEER